MTVAATARLDRVCEITMGQAPEGSAYNTDGRGWPLIAGASDFGDGTPAPKKFTTAASRVSSWGDLVLSIRATIGPKVIANGEYCLGRGVAGIRPGPELDHRFLWHWMTYATPELESKSKGATFKQVNKQDIGELAIPLPPLAEQRRIAEILDRADALRNKRRAALATLDEVLRAVFVDMFGDPVSNSKGLPRRRIGDIGTVITGNTPPRARADYYGDAIEWVKSDNLNRPDYFVTTAEEGLSDAGRRVGRWVAKNAILVTCIAGTPDCIGNAGLTDREVAFNQQINALVPTVGNPHFIYGQIRVGKTLIQQASTKAMKGMISKSRFANVELIFPPLHEQDRFARRALQAEATRRACGASLHHSEALVASLQDRAFRGEL